MSYFGHNLDVMPTEGADGLHMIGVYYCDFFFYCVSSLEERVCFFKAAVLVSSIVPGT